MLPAAAAAQQPGHGSPNLSYVQNIPYAQRFADQPASFGTDMELATVRGAKHAVAGSYYNGMHIVDIRKPDTPKLVGRYDCGIPQGDVQVFRAADGTGRTLAAYTADSASRKTDTACFREATALGFQPIAADGRGKQGTFIVDISNPAAPRTVSFVEVPQGSHNMTVHPSGGWLYNSNSDLITSLQPAIEIIDIRNPALPKHAGELSFSARPGLGTESHDITFNASGTRAYSAALSHGVVIDTTNPASPRVISEFDDETINVWHQSDPFTLRLPNGQQKSFLIVEDEFAGAAGGPVCPSGGVHVYDITGANEASPKKVGYWNITDEAGPTLDPEGTCTAHVFDIHESAQLMTIAFYKASASSTSPASPPAAASRRSPATRPTTPTRGRSRRRRSRARACSTPSATTSPAGSTCTASTVRSRRAARRVSGSPGPRSASPAARRAGRCRPARRPRRASTATA